ncbi:hypothetical protein DL98DRAFT_610858 [Cadophora sp. DSE1049]|nr:hypothetical protein DL98DRAFT_610858 [Cadophora sp. DSE1049]
MAGTIGTWVAVFLALFALIGIVGPFFIWRASRTDRHQAITLVGMDNGGFISKGILGFYRTIHAPMLSQEPSFEDRAISIDFAKLKDLEIKSPANWVKFGLALRSFNLKFSEGDPLLIRNGKTWLPVHRYWFISFGLLGRYCPRRDKGKLRDPDRTVSFGTPVLDISGVDLQSLSGRNRRDTMYGFNGNLRFSSEDEDDSTAVTFTPSLLADIGKAVEEKLELSRLFWLALGCIPARGNRCFSLGDAVKEEEDDSDDESEDDDWGVRTMTRLPRSARNTYIGEPSYHHAADIVRPAADSSIIPFQLGRILDQDDRFGYLPTPFRASGMQAFGIQQFSLPPGHPEQVSLEAIGSVTFVPATTPWVRLSRGERRGKFAGKRCYLRRQDAHQMAHALLTLPWHPESYLIGCNQETLCRDFLTAVAPRFIQILARMKANIGTIGLGSNERAALFEVLARVEKSAKIATHRSTLHVLYDLDVVLENVSHSNKLVNDIVGILMIANEEFSGLVSQSARHLEVSTSSVVEIDLRAGTLRVPSAFGVIQSFVVDLHAIYPDTRSESETLSVNHSMVLVASLKACLRSFLLKNCLESEPLLKLVGGDSEVLDFD